MYIGIDDKNEIPLPLLQHLQKCKS